MNFFRQLKEDIQVQRNKAQREARKGEELKKELSQAKSDLENRTAELKTGRKSSKCTGRHHKL